MPPAVFERESVSFLLSVPKHSIQNFGYYVSISRELYGKRRFN